MATDAPKPYIQTSYFKLLIAALILGPLFLVGLSYGMLQVPMSADGREKIFEVAMQGWLFILGLLGFTNAAARGLVSVIKTAAQSKSDPATIEAALKGSIQDLSLAAQATIRSGMDDVKQAVTEKAAATVPAPRPARPRVTVAHVRADKPQS